jgi:hypothetical protein
MQGPIREVSPGTFSVALRPCTTAVIGNLSLGEGFVWIRGHRPQTVVRWWEATVPLSANGFSGEVLVRDVSYDLHFPAPRVSELLPAFAGLGIDLCLMSKPVPDTFTLQGVPRELEFPLLVHNGLVARFDLPHANEVAIVSTTRRALLASWVLGPLADWVQT